MRHRIALILASALLATAAVPTSAGKPVMERVPINDVGVLDEFLTETCGFNVWTDATGHITFRQFQDAGGNPVREVNNYGIRLRIYSEFASIRAVDVGVDRVTYLEDGSIINIITGNVQSFSVKGRGRVYADVGQTTVHITFPEEGDPIVEVLRQVGQHSETPQEEVICEVLGG